MLSILLYSFIFFIDIARATCAVDVDEDVIFLLDFSTSMDEDDFELMKEFAARLARETLPEGARVACLGFGSYPTVFFNFAETYDSWSGEATPIVDATGEWYANEIIETAYYWGGSTKLGMAITAIIHGNEDYLIDPVIDAESLCCRKTLLIIMTDGIATDLLGPIREDLFATNTKTIVIGIGNQFVSYYMLEIVDSEDDIHEVDSFAELSNVYDTLRTYICESDVEIAVTEFKVEGDRKFIEIMNLGRTIRTDELMVESNVIQAGSFYFPASAYNVSAGDLLVLYEDQADFEVNHCLLRYVNETNCLAFKTDLLENADTWEFNFKQVETTARRLLNTQLSDITSATLRASDLNLQPIRTEYSYERKVSPLGDSQSIAANWVESCARYGSPGTVEEQFSTCNARCAQDSDDCGPEGTCDIQADGDFGCTCPDVGYRTYDHTCEPIPLPKQCNVTGLMPIGVNKNDTKTVFQATVKWDPADDSTIAGHQFVWGTGSNTADFSGGIPELQITATYSQFSTMFIMTVGQQECFYISQSLACRVLATSHYLTCDNQLVEQKTAPPTAKPSHAPTRTPSHQPSAPPQFSQPTVTVFLNEWSTGDNMTYVTNGKRFFKEVRTTSQQDLVVTLRVYGTSDMYETLVSYGLYESHSDGAETLLQVGNHTFPPSALYVADTFEINFGKIDMQNGALTERKLSFKLFPTETLDQFGRALYKLSDPSEADILVEYEEPFIESATEKEKLPWWIYPAIGAGVLIIAIVAAYFVCKARKKRAVAETRRKEAEEDVRRAEDGFFLDAVDVKDNPLREIQLRHQKKETITLNDNVEMITYDDDEKFDMRTNDNFSQQVAYTTTSGYTAEGLPNRHTVSRMPHRKLTSDQDPSLKISGHLGAAPVNDSGGSSGSLKFNI